MPRRLSLDEAHHCCGHELATVVSDPDRRCVLEVIDDRTRRRLEPYLRSISVAGREAIKVVSIDPYDAYRQAVRAILPHATVVCDTFTGCRLASDLVVRGRSPKSCCSGEDLLAHFDEPVTNGYAEGMINRIKTIKRRAYGLPSFDRFLEGCS